MLVIDCVSMHGAKSSLSTNQSFVPREISMICKLITHIKAAVKIDSEEITLGKRILASQTFYLTLFQL